MPEVFPAKETKKKWIDYSSIGLMFPASILRTHPGCDLFLDRDAAGLLSQAGRSA